VDVNFDVEDSENDSGISVQDDDNGAPLLLDEIIQGVLDDKLFDDCIDGRQNEGGFDNDKIIDADAPRRR
jgi:hypothetical protein